MLKIITVAVAALSLAGCAALTTDFNSAVNTIDAPATQQAVATVSKVATAVVCAVSSTSSIAQEVEVSAGASKGATSEVYAISSTICSALGGSVIAAAPANVTAVTAVAPLTAVSFRLRRAMPGVRYVTITVPA